MHIKNYFLLFLSIKKINKCIKRNNKQIYIQTSKSRIFAYI